MPIAIRANKREYSKYDPDLAWVDLTATGVTVATVYQFALVREDGFGDVILLIDSPQADPYTLRMPLFGGDVEFPGELSATRAGINYVRQGMYHLEVRDDLGVLLARSASFPISVIPLEEFRRSYLFGVPLYAEEVMMVAAQPRSLTGARVTYVDPAMLKGPGMLDFVVDDGTLSWRGGPVGTIVGDEVQLARLLTPEGDAYLEVEVDPFVLPIADTTESLLIDNWRMTDTDLRRYLWHAYEWVQQQLQLRLETTITTTDPTTYAGYYDETAEAIGLERNRYRSIDIGSPRTKPLRKVVSLAGFYVDSPTLVIPDTWITVEERGAMIELIPLAGSVTVGQNAPIMYPYGASRDLREIQDFWHFTVIAGLRTLEGERYSIREAIGKKAALDLLTDLSLAASAGRMSRSASREGVSESWGYSGQGAYGEKTVAYAEWLKISIPKLRQYFNGLNVVVL